MYSACRKGTKHKNIRAKRPFQTVTVEAKTEEMLWGGSSCLIYYISTFYPFSQDHPISSPNHPFIPPLIELPSLKPHSRVSVPTSRVRGPWGGNSTPKRKPKLHLHLKTERAESFPPPARLNRNLKTVYGACVALRYMNFFESVPRSTLKSCL